jgi:hypothetical protein
MPRIRELEESIDKGITMLVEKLTERAETGTAIDIAVWAQWYDFESPFTYDTEIS